MFCWNPPMNNKKSQNKDGFFFLKRDPKQVRKLRNEILGIWAGICQEFGGKKRPWTCKSSRSKMYRYRGLKERQSQVGTYQGIWIRMGARRIFFYWGLGGFFSGINHQGWHGKGWQKQQINRKKLIIVLMAKRIF